jgi:hypothetical protein
MGAGRFDAERLLFGAGFAFGVTFSMVVLSVVTVTIVSGTDRPLAAEVVVTLAAGVCFAAVVGAGLLLLAFPERRVEIPLRIAGRDGEDEE